VLLELLHERARELLTKSGDELLLRDRHLTFIAELLEDLERRRWGDASATWIDEIQERLAEVRAAHEWAVQSGDVVRAARITASMGAFWHREGHHADGHRWVAHALEHRDEIDRRTAAQVDLAAGFLSWARGQEEAGRHWASAIEGFRAEGDQRYLAYALALSSGQYIGDHDRYDEGIELSTEAIELARAVGDPPLIAQALNVRGEIERVHGDDDAALVDYLEGERLSAEIGDRAHQTIFLANLAYLATHRGEHQEARQLGARALEMCWSMGRRMMAAWTISEMAGPELGLGRPERAAWLVGAAEEALRVLGVTRHPGDVPEHVTVMADLAAELGDRLDGLLAEGARLSLGQAVDLALSEATDLGAIPDG
jgi:non-specific serine/threonine protein kinase